MPRVSLLIARAPPTVEPGFGYSSAGLSRAACGLRVPVHACALQERPPGRAPRHPSLCDNPALDTTCQPDSAPRAARVHRLHRGTSLPFQAPMLACRVPDASCDGTDPSGQSADRDPSIPEPTRSICVPQVLARRPAVPAVGTGRTSNDPQPESRACTLSSRPVRPRRAQRASRPRRSPTVVNGKSCRGNRAHIPGGGLRS